MLQRCGRLCLRAARPRVPLTAVCLSDEVEVVVLAEYRWQQEFSHGPLDRESGAGAAVRAVSAVPRAVLVAVVPVVPAAWLAAGPVVPAG